MKLPNWLKIVWWAVLVLGLAILLFPRREAIVNGQAAAFDIFVFLVWAALLLVPLYQEVNFFGLSLKQEIEDLKAQVKADITGLKSDIRNSIELRTDVSPHIHLYDQPPADKQLEKQEEQIKRVLDNTLKSYGIEGKYLSEWDIERVPDDVSLLFKVRYNLDKEIRRIWAELAGGDEQLKLPASRIINDLAKRVDLIDLQTILLIVRKIYPICSAAIHGEEISEEHLNFVKNAAPKLITSLKAIEFPKPPPNNSLNTTRA